MKILNSKNGQENKLILSVLIFCGLIGLNQDVYCLQAPTQLEDSAATKEQTTNELFEYTIEGRNDPFSPFISEQATSAKMDEILPVEDNLSGMQLFEPGQLTLVAIVLVDDNEYAMAEDTTGKGYILRTGMEIGRRGIITGIRPNEVIIEETAFTRAGKKLTSNIVMLLKKEGGE
jgi:type IV pilus assembly protein PilP